MREMVAAAVKASLPEFCRRNNIHLSEPVMENLAYWVISVIPPNMVRQPCPNTPYPCACLGTCMEWQEAAR